MHVHVEYGKCQISPKHCCVIQPKSDRGILVKMIIIIMFRFKKKCYLGLCRMCLIKVRQAF